MFNLYTYKQAPYFLLWMKNNNHRTRPGGIRGAFESAAHGRACSGFVRRLTNLLSPGGPRIPPCRPTCSPQNASFLRPFFCLHFWGFWALKRIPKWDQNHLKMRSKVSSTPEAEFTSILRPKSMPWNLENWALASTKRSFSLSSFFKLNRNLVHQKKTKITSACVPFSLKIGD